MSDTESPTTYLDPVNDQVVYFIMSEEMGLVKIGIAKNPFKRLMDMSCGNPDTLTLRGVIPATKPREVERMLHREFQEHRVRGEWFRPVQEMWDLLKILGIPVEDYRRHRLEAQGIEWRPLRRVTPQAPSDRRYSSGPKGRMERYLAARGLAR